MAELPRYKSSGLQVASPEGQFRDVSAPMDALSKGMNQMTSFFMQSAQEQAVVEGEKYGAENAPSLEQIATARKLNEPLKPVAEQFTYFGRAATETSNRILAKNISADADMALDKLSARISRGEIPINQITSQTNALIQGYSTVLKDINPALGRSVEADLALSGNRMFLAASKAAAAEALAAQQEKVADTVTKTLPSTIAQIFKTGSVAMGMGVLSVEDQLGMAKSKAQNMINSLPPKQAKEMSKKLDGLIKEAASNSIDERILTGENPEQVISIKEELQKGVYNTTIPNAGDRLVLFNKANSRLSALEQEENNQNESRRILVLNNVNAVQQAIQNGVSLNGLDTQFPDVEDLSDLGFTGQALDGVLKKINSIKLVGLYGNQISNMSATDTAKFISDLEEKARTGDIQDAPMMADALLLLKQNVAVDYASDAEKRNAIRQELTDVAAIVSGGGTLPKDALSKFSKDILEKSFAGDDLKLVLQSKEKIEAIYSAVSGISSMSKEEQSQFINDMKDVLKPENVEDVAGADLRLAVLEAASAAVQNKELAIQQDPALYVFTNFPEVKKALDRTLKPDATPEDMGQFVTLMNLTQTKLGVRPENVKLLTKLQADEFVNDFNSQTANGINMADQLAGQAARWGTAFPQVLNQLDNDLPEQISIIADLALVDPSTAQILSNAFAKGAKADIEATVKESNKDITDSVELLMGTFRNATINITTNGAANYRKYYGAVELLTKVYVSQNLSPENAAQKAYDKVIGNFYAFEDTFSMPRAIVKDPDLVSRNALLVLENINQIPLKIPDNFRGVSPEQAKTEYVSHLKNFGMIVNTEDESKGLMIADEFGNIVMIRDVFGERKLILPWSYLSQIKTNAPSFGTLMGMGGGMRRDFVVPPIPIQ
jgi:hypothetical protein